MGKMFLRKKYIVHNDDIIFWGIINSANKYGFLEKIGYFYNTKNPKIYDTSLLQN